jgi:hypothetical protein
MLILDLCQIIMIHAQIKLFSNTHQFHKNLSEDSNDVHEKSLRPVKWNKIEMAQQNLV